ncbi:unnamed protein product, partial [Didymodactylos carnosus]
IAQTIRDDEEQKKHRFSKKYLFVVQLLFDILKQKTRYIQQIANNDSNEGATEKFDIIIKKFQEIDQVCEGEIHQVHYQSSLKIITHLADQLQTIQRDTRE